MKRLIPTMLAAAALVFFFNSRTVAEPLPSGQVDFGKFSPPNSGAEFVEVNLSSSLISMAARIVPKDQPEISQLISGLHLIHVNVIGLDDQNRGDMEKRVKKVRADLDSQGWERLVTAQKEGKDVGVYLKTQGTNAIAGLAIVAMEAQKHVVFVNIVGNIRPEQVAEVGERLHIEQLKSLGGTSAHKEDSTNKN
jgi:hypothetical protein